MFARKAHFSTSPQPSPIVERETKSTLLFLGEGVRGWGKKNEKYNSTRFSSLPREIVSH